MELGDSWLFARWFRDLRAALAAILAASAVLALVTYIQVLYLESMRLRTRDLERQLTLARAVAPTADIRAPIKYKNRRSDSTMVIGTTGLNQTQLAEIKKLSRQTPILLSANMSLGVNLLVSLLGKVAKTLGDDYDVEIIEAHHRFKKDAPSGTALALGRAAAAQPGWVLQRAASSRRNYRWGPGGVGEQLGRSAPGRQRSP